MADAFASAWVEVLPDFQDFRRKANNEMTGILGPAGDNAGRVGGQGMGVGLIAGFGRLAGPIGAALVAVIAAAGIGDAINSAVKFGFESIDLASDLAETRSAVGQVFGDAAKDIQAYAATANKNLGQTQQEALAASQTFGVFGQSAGLAGKDLSGFTTDLVGLSADFASFYNTSPQEAIDAITAGLRGESEPLRKYGVFLDDAALKAKALELGIYDGNGALTQQQRVLAANAAIFSQSGVAQGDFARTSDGLANSQRSLSASFEDAKTRLGEALLPSLTGLVTLLNDNLVPILNDTVDKVGPALADALQQSGPAFKDLLLAIVPLIPQMVDLAVNALPPIVDFFVAVAPLILDFITYLSASREATNAIFSLLAGDTTFAEFTKTVSGLGSTFFDVLQKLTAFTLGGAVAFVQFNSDVQSNLARVIASIIALPGQAVAALGNLGAVLISSGRSLIQGFIDGIKQMAKPVTDVVSGIMSAVTDFFPHSPAKTGPLSGTGWTAIESAGEALWNQFNGGFGGGQLAMSGVNLRGLTAGRVPSSAFVGATTAGGAGAITLNMPVTTPPNEDPRVLAKGLGHVVMQSFAGRI